MYEVLMNEFRLFILEVHGRGGRHLVGEVLVGAEILQLRVQGVLIFSFFCCLEAVLIHSFQVDIRLGAARVLGVDDALAGAVLVTEHISHVEVFFGLAPLLLYNLVQLRLLLLELLLHQSTNQTHNLISILPQRARSRLQGRGVEQG